MRKIKDKLEHSKSAEAFSEARRYLPGGVNSPVRAFGGVGLRPLFIDRAKGAKIYDIDGNAYIDYVGSWGPMILGHAHPAVVKAINKAARKGTSYGAPTLAETELAKKIHNAFASIEKLRLVSSGTEAVMTAIRLARGYKRKDLIIKMAGCYHGHSDSLLVAAGSGAADLPSPAETGYGKAGHAAPSSAGIPPAIANLTVVIPYNDIEAVKNCFLVHRGKIAAVLVEPVAANMGVVPAAEGYLQMLRDLCDAEEAVLIFDEVITGFRIARGGAQELYGVKADVTCLGKIIGGGLPLAAVGGQAAILDMLAPTGPVYQAGTLSGNPIATAAANATLDILAGDDCYGKLEAKAGMLADGLKDAAGVAGVPVVINRVGSILSCFFTDRPVSNFEDVQSTDTHQFKKFFAQMLARDIY
ncbi:MAG: glutamate-1-semialdehyde 2,1-aminomutase, partial [Planctomycetes bacterium]|nr:glutamate-1-semialdehyde 2,1-aminomutase [Planctomycetota bacterium]